MLDLAIKDFKSQTQNRWIINSALKFSLSRQTCKEDAEFWVFALLKFHQKTIDLSQI